MIYVDQANHNRRFHDCIAENFPDDYFDWRITVLFYIANHYLNALAAKTNRNIGSTHEENARQVNPKKNGDMPISETAWKNYRRLFAYSCNARYLGIRIPADFGKVMRRDYEHCLKLLEDFRKYVSGRGVNV